MGDVFLYCLANDPVFRLIPAHAGGVEMVLEPQERPDRHSDVISLCASRSGLGLVNPAALLQAPMIILDRPTQVGVLQASQLVHAQVVGCPVRNVTVWGDNLEDQDQTETLQVDRCARRRDRGRADGTTALTVEIDQPIRLQSGHPEPTMSAYGLEVFEAGVPTVEQDITWGKATCFRHVEHGEEVVVLGQAVVGFVVDPVVTGDASIAVGPEQGDEVDAPDDGVMFAGPVAIDQFDLFGVGLIERGIVEDQDAFVALGDRLGLAPKGLGVGLKPIEQAGKGIVSRCNWGVGLHSSGLRTTERGERGHKEINRVHIPAFGRAHVSHH